MMRRMFIAVALLVATAAVAQENDDYTNSVSFEGKGGVPQNIIRVSAGPALIVSEVQTDHGTYKHKWGTELGIDYDHLWRSQANPEIGWGFGVNYAYNTTSFGGDGNLKQHYFGASVVFDWRRNNWLWSAAYGLGYAYYDEPGYSQGGLGVLMKLGGEYMVSQHVGIGVQANLIYTTFKKPDWFKTDSDKRYGFDRLNILGGIRFYF